MISDSELEQRVDELVEVHADHLTDAAMFRGAQFDAGLAMVHFPEGHGGLGPSRAQQSVVDDALRKHKG